MASSKWQEIRDYLKGNYPKATLIAVSKNQTIEDIITCYKNGCRDFGESYAPEFIDKKNYLDKQGYQDIKWHFIGNIQSNKIKIIVKADYIHSVCSISHAQKISDMSDGSKKIFVQVYLGEDDKRLGVRPDALELFFNQLHNFKNLNILGLMTILPYPKNSKTYDTDVYFDKMATIKNEFEQKKIMEQCYLSMGMSTDYKEALMRGADFIRLGTYIFGARKC